MSDLIYRQAAIDAIMASTSKYTGFMEMEMYTADDAVEAIKVVPTASPWHRVEERLPEPHEYVLCCGKKGGCFVGWTLDNADVVKANGHGRAFVHGGNARTFTHWMPLPEPPKEE